MNALASRLAVPALILALLCALAGGFAWAMHVSHQRGYAEADRAWSEKWNDHIDQDRIATLEADSRERQKEQAYQRSMEKVTTNAQINIDNAAAASDNAARSDRLRELAEKRLADLERSSAGTTSCTAAASQAATKTARVFADMLAEANAVAGVYAAAADQAIERGLACEAADAATR